MNNILFLLITSTFVYNVCTGTGMATPCLLAYKRSFAYTLCLNFIFVLLLLLTGLSYYLIYNYLLLEFGLEVLSLMVLVGLVGVFSFILDALLKSINKEAYFIYEKSYTFLFMFIAVLGVLMSVTANQTIVQYLLTLGFSALGFIIINFIIYGAYFKINGSYAPKFMKGLPLLLVVLAILGMAFTLLGKIL